MASKKKKVCNWTNPAHNVRCYDEPVPGKKKCVVHAWLDDPKHPGHAVRAFLDGPEFAACQKEMVHTVGLLSLAMRHAEKMAFYITNDHGDPAFWDHEALLRLTLQTVVSDLAHILKTVADFQEKP